MKPTYSKRADHLRSFIARLFDDLDATVEAVVADGWPEAMVRAGFELHRRTWDVDALRAAFEAELAGFGGAEALEGFVEDRAGRRVRLVRPESAVHIWPALPGSGLTPVLFGALLGVPQWIRPSSRGRGFAEHVVDSWPQNGPGLKLIEPGQPWTFAEVVVVSGSDETVAEVRRLSNEAAAGRRTFVAGYGHRVSFGVVVDGPEANLEQIAADLATDTVMWHQMGCFSPRAVLFCGSEERLAAFGQALGEAIAAAETRLEATDLDAGQLASRAQARGVAEFTKTLWGDGLGWVELSDEPFSGAQIAPHTLSLHRVDSPAGLADVVDVPPMQLQGVALEAADGVRDDWAEALAELGATRICRAGELQAPPAGWLHDGRANVLGWLRASTRERARAREREP